MHIDIVLTTLIVFHVMYPLANFHCTSKCVFSFCQ